MKNLILFCLLLTGIIYSQDLISDQYNFASSLYNQGNYFESVTEFKRLLFFDSTDTYSAEAEYYIGLSYKKGGFYSEAIEHFSRSEINTTDENKIFNIRVEIIKSNILRRTSLRAFQLIDQLAIKTTSSQLLAELNLLRGYAYAFSGEWEKAAEFFRISGRADLEKLSIETNDQMYSELKAKLLSVFLPGAGQIYTGNYMNGIISFIWNAFTGYLTVNSFIEERVFDGLVIGNFLLYRFYSGNIYNAENFARQKNIEISNRTLKIMQSDSGYSLY